MGFDLLDSLQKEKKQAKNNPIKIEKDSALEEMVAGFNEFNKTHVVYDTPIYSNLEIETFSILLNSFGSKESEYTGFYINTLILRCKDKTICIHPFNYCPNHIGSNNNGKTITIYGDVGNFIGSQMNSGILSIYGNARHHAGSFLKGGKIDIFGDVGHWLGSTMGGGEIIVYGNGGDYVGMGMSNGIIRLENDYKSISSSLYGGQIFHKNELIYNGGWKV